MLFTSSPWYPTYPLAQRYTSSQSACGWEFLYTWNSISSRTAEMSAIDYLFFDQKPALASVMPFGPQTVLVGMVVSPHSRQRQVSMIINHDLGNGEELFPIIVFVS